MSSRVLITIVVFIVVAVVVSAPTALVLYGDTNIGSADKTVWDLMDVLGVPLSAAVIAGLLGIAAQRAGQRAEIERELAIDRSREATLRAYLGQMTDLIVKEGLGLGDSQSDQRVRTVAQAHTFGALRILDGPRKGIVIRFLHDSGLITGDEPTISLALADLTGADLGGADLHGTNLTRANLDDADVFGANLQGALLNRALASDEQLAKASDLTGATLPDGTEMTDERWIEFKEQL